MSFPIRELNPDSIMKLLEKTESISLSHSSLLSEGLHPNDLELSSVSEDSSNELLSERVRMMEKYMQDASFLSEDTSKSALRHSQLSPSKTIDTFETSRMVSNLNQKISNLERKMNDNLEKLKESNSSQLNSVYLQDNVESKLNQELLKTENRILNKVKAMVESRNQQILKGLPEEQIENIIKEQTDKALSKIEEKLYSRFEREFGEKLKIEQLKTKELSVKLQNSEKEIKLLKDHIHRIESNLSIQVTRTRVLEHKETPQSDNESESAVEIHSKLNKLKRHLIKLDQELNEMPLEIEKTIDSKIRKALESDHLHSKFEKMETVLDQKLDNQVVEELMRHIATRDELQELANSVSKDPIMESRVNKLEKTVSQEFNHEYKSAILQFINENINKTKQEFEKKLASVKKHIKNQSSDRKLSFLNSVPQENIPNNLDGVYLKLAKDFDEKMQFLFNELGSCKQAWQLSIKQPFYRCAQWIWRSGLLRYGSAVPWNIESSNTGNIKSTVDPNNFRWQEDSVNIKVEEGGLYEISFAFFTKSKPSLQLVVNGESVLSAINSSSYIVHHSSGYIMNGEGRMEEGTVTGISLIDFIALPFKSTLSLHYHGGRKGHLGHGFLSLRKL